MRKRLIQTSIITLVVGLALMACRQKGNGEQASGIIFDSLRVDKTTAISSAKRAPTCQVSLSLIYARSNDRQSAAIAQGINSAIAKCLFDADGRSIRQAADSFATQYVRNYRQDMGAMYTADRNDDSKRSWYEYRYQVRSAVQTAQDGHFIYKAYINYFEGGTHGNKQMIALNFNCQTGQRMTLDDIFVPGFQAGLNRKLLEVLMENTGTESLEELHSAGYLFSMDMFTPDNFIIGDSSITFIYNPYEIATYDKGLVKLKLKYSELGELLIRHQP